MSTHTQGILHRRKEKLHSRNNRSDDMTKLDNQLEQYRSLTAASSLSHTYCLVSVDFPWQWPFVHQLPLGQVQILPAKTTTKVHQILAQHIVKWHCGHDQLLTCVILISSPWTPRSWDSHSAWRRTDPAVSGSPPTSTKTKDTNHAVEVQWTLVTSCRESMIYCHSSEDKDRERWCQRN